MIVVQTAFSTVMTAIGVLSAILCVAFVLCAYFAPETLATAIPQITDMVASCFQNAQAIIKNLNTKI